MLTHLLEVVLASKYQYLLFGIHSTCSLDSAQHFTCLSYSILIDPEEVGVIVVAIFSMNKLRLREFK